MLKRWAVVLLCLIASTVFVSCANRAQVSEPQQSAPGASAPQASERVTNESKLKIFVTFNAMKEFTQAVGGDKIEVSAIIPDGMEAHGFEPKPQDLTGLSVANVFVYNGLGMEGWVEEAVHAVNNPNLIVVDASQGADVITKEVGNEEHHDEEDHHDGEEEEGHDHHAHGKYDPHLWLGLKGAQTQVNTIKNALVAADPANKEYYERNCQTYVAQLDALFNEYKVKFESKQKKNFVTGHAAFGYLCRDFGLSQNSVQDIFAEGEPSAQQLAELIEYCKTNQVTTIFAEEMASPEVSQTLANEVGAKVETIYTMESAEDGKTYLERMKENLEKIYASLTK